MDELYANKDFMFTETCDKSVLRKLESSMVIENLLNDKLSIKDFSKTVTSVFMIYQSLKPEYELVFPIEERSIFKRKTNVIEIYTVIDHRTLRRTIRKKNILKLLAQTYLSAILKFLKRKDFDWETFYNEVERIFIDGRLLSKK